MSGFLLLVATHVLAAVAAGVFTYLSRHKIERALNK